MEIFDSEIEIEMLQELIVTFAPKIFLSILYLIIGLRFIKWINKIVKIRMEGSEMEPSLVHFLAGMLKTLMQVLLVLSIMSTLGIEMTSFVAILGSIGLAIGMALSGTLQNFAGGVMLLLFKPFKVGHVIQAQGHTGTVNQIQIFNTILKTPDGKTIILPNGSLSNSSMVNLSLESEKRLELVYSIAYGDDIDVAIQHLQELCDADERILKEPESMIVVKALGESSVDIMVRVWTKSEDFWNVNFDLNKKVYESFHEKQLHFPYPTMDINISK